MIIGYEHHDGALSRQESGIVDIFTTTKGNFTMCHPIPLFSHTHTHSDYQGLKFPPIQVSIKRICLDLEDSESKQHLESWFRPIALNVANFHNKLTTYTNK